MNRTNLSRSEVLQSGSRLMYNGSTMPGMMPNVGTHTQATFMPSINEPSLLNRELEEFMADMKRLQETQLQQSIKIAKEKKDSLALDEAINNTKRELDILRDSTKNGEINRLDEIQSKRLIAKQEFQLQTINSKLSVAKQDNINLKHKIDDVRRDKSSLLKIMKGLENKHQESLDTILRIQSETAMLNEQTHITKLSLASIKNKIINDIEEFESKLEEAQENITKSQANVVHAIHDKMETTMASIEESKIFLKSIEKVPANTNGLKKISIPRGCEAEVALLLRSINLSSVDVLVNEVRQAEESIFTSYHRIQDLNAELETLESDNKILQRKISIQSSELNHGETKNDTRRQEIDSQISSIQEVISNLNIQNSHSAENLKTYSDALLRIGKEIASDEDFQDIHLQATGITERNIIQFLGLMEYHIDNIIQLHKAALHESLNKDDFIRIPNVDRVGVLQVPNLPSLSNQNPLQLETEEPEGDGRVEPIDISALKETIAIKMKALQASKNISDSRNVHVTSSKIRNHSPNRNYLSFSRNFESKTSLNSNRSSRLSK